jgi:hypothetical protein
MFVYCVVHINHNCQHRWCPYAPPPPFPLSVRVWGKGNLCLQSLSVFLYYMIIPTSSLLFPIFHMTPRFPSIRLAFRWSCWLFPTGCVHWIFLAIASGIIRRATPVYKSFHKENKIKRSYLRSSALYPKLRDKFGLSLALGGGGGGVVKRFLANFIFIHTTVILPYLAECNQHYPFLLACLWFM